MRIELLGQHLWMMDENHQVIPARDVYQWAEFFENNRAVAATNINGLYVSTIFLGIDHAFGFGGPPILFETMIFASEKYDPPENLANILDWAHGYQTRYCTWDEAVKGHENIITIIREGLF
jgi:hypothetical protein